MAYSYDLKIIVSGKQAEIYKYQKRIWKEYKRTVDNERKPKQLDIFEQAANRKLRAKSSANRTRTELRRLVNSNPCLSKFLTLTFADNITDLKQSNYIFNQFVKRLTYKYPELKYIAVFEFQKRGAVHYHLLCDFPYTDSKELESIWKHGFIKIKRTNNINNIGAYISKYLGKQIDERTFGKKKYFKSQNLDDPIELLGFRAEQFIEKYLSQIAPAFKKDFYSEWKDKIQYSSYNLDLYPFKNIDRTKPIMIE